jgi:hypothetical protein
MCSAATVRPGEETRAHIVAAVEGLLGGVDAELGAILHSQIDRRPYHQVIGRFKPALRRSGAQGMPSRS